MKHLRNIAPPPARATQRGFSIIELSIAMVIAVFLLAGLFTILDTTRHTSTDQAAMAQLQDNERLAMSLLTEMIESAGYYPYSAGNSLETALPIDGTTFPTAGQSISGQGNGAAGDNLVVRFQTNSGDGVVSCLGNTNTTGGTFVYKNTFIVDPTAQQLQCSDSNGVGAVPLANGIQKMVIRWGVNSAATVPNANCPADTYVATGAMTNLTWTNVCTIEITLTFTNPLRTPVPGQVDPNQPVTVDFKKVIAIMGKSGNNV